MSDSLFVSPRFKAVLDPDFVPAVLWNRAYRAQAAAGVAENLAIALERSDGSVSVYETKILPQREDTAGLNIRYVERLVKALLWQRGGYKVTIAGNTIVGDLIRSNYSAKGDRACDYDVMGRRIYDRPFSVEVVDYSERPAPAETTAALGGHLDGCRIGFDLGGSDRKAAALINGEVVFSEEIVWDPYFKSDPQWHFDQINDSLKRAAAKLPRVDAIGGSAAGVYVNNEVRVASLFRGVPPDQFDSRVRRIFFDLQREWKGIPFVVVNDGEVAALAGSMAMNDNAVLGVAMGTSQAAGYVTPEGTITNWLNELAFAPLDYRPGAPKDEWSGDDGCGAQYFSQQAVGRLVPAAGIELPTEMPLPEKLIAVQQLMEQGDERAHKIYETIGVYFGYTVAHYAEFYELRNVLVMGRVLSGSGGNLIMSQARQVLEAEFPELLDRVQLRTPSEQEKRHGQAVAAASLPRLS